MLSMSNSPAARRPDLTRERILGAAFAEFYRNGFQGGSLNRIVASAGVTKGALFHHFDGKQELGYAVVDDLIAPLLSQRWLAPVEDTDDPIAAIQRTFRRYIEEDVGTGEFVHGCPLNNLAQEMSPLDEGFRSRIETLYARWRDAFAAALARGVREGTVRPDVDAGDVAALLVVAQMGIWGTGKYSRDEALMRKAGEALCDQLDTLRPDPPTLPQESHA